jgi:putative redox protein
MKKAQIKWTGGMQFVGQADSGHAVVMDADGDNGGQNSAARPGELPLIALGGCTGIDVIMILTKMQVQIEAFEIAVEAEAAEEHPKVWTKIHVIYTLTGDIPEKKVKKAVELSHEKYCSVGAVLGATARMSYEYKILPSGSR